MTRIPSSDCHASSDGKFTTALGRAPTGLYDLALRLFTREKRWRGIVLNTLSLQPGDRVLDVGCGTGTLAISIKERNPATKLTALDPDHQALALAATKAQRAKTEIVWAAGFARDAALGRVNAFDVVTCTLVLHQVPLHEKRAGLAAMFEALRPGGKLILADYGEQRSASMRMLFRQTVQRIDGKADTRPNAEGILPDLLAEAGFEDIAEIAAVPTLSGSIAIFTAHRGSISAPQTGPIGTHREVMPHNDP